MAFEQRDNSGALFKNKDRASDSHPTHKGTIKIEGVEYWLSAWVKETKAGEKFFSLSVKAKDGMHSVKPKNEMNDEMPW